MKNVCVSDERMKSLLEKELTRQADKATKKAKSLMERMNNCPVKIKPFVVTQEIEVEFFVDTENPFQNITGRGSLIKSFEGLLYKDNTISYFFGESPEDYRPLLSEDRRTRVSSISLLDKMEKEFLAKIEKDSEYPESVVGAVLKRLELEADEAMEYLG